MLLGRLAERRTEVGPSVPGAPLAVLEGRQAAWGTAGADTGPAVLVASFAVLETGQVAFALVEVSDLLIWSLTSSRECQIGIHRPRSYDHAQVQGFGSSPEADLAVVTVSVLEYLP